MPYIGNDIQYGELNSQTFTGDGSTTAFTLNYTVSNVNSLLVTVADVIQEPTTAYTVSGTTLTFTSAPANSDTIHVRYLGRTLDVGTTAIVQDSDQDTKIQVEESADEDTIRFDTGGTERVTINSTSLTSTTPLYIPDGSASAPSVTNTGDTNTGIFFPAADTVGVAVGGTEVWRFGSNPTTAKNLIDNGAMTVAQRGTSANIGASPVFTLDRWRWAQSSGTNGTMEQWSTAPTGFGLSLRINPSNAQTPGATEYNIVGQRIEAQNLQHLLYGTASAKDLTLQFWVRSPKTGTHTFAAYQNDKAGGRLYVGTYTVAVADTWELITHTIPGDASGQIDNDTGNGFDIVWNVGSGSNYETGTVNAWQTSASFLYSTSGAANCLDDAAKDFAIAGVQLEVGSVATDFEHEDIGETRRKCLRRFWRWKIQSASGQIFGSITMNTATNALMGPVVHPVPMAGAPTVTMSNVGHATVADGANANKTISAFTPSSTPDSTHMLFAVASGTTGGGYIYRDVTDALYFDFNYEL